MRRAVLVFALIFLLVAAVYRRVPTAFLRAESGWYLALSHSDEAAQRSAIRNFFTGSYGGHYTPLAFLSEFEMAKIAGTSRAFWRWRQIFAVAVVGAALFVLTTAISRMLGMPGKLQLATAAALAAINMFQPIMVDFVTWPFMILQLAWLGLSIAALYCLLKVLSDPEQPRWPWLAAVTAYASLHASGLGLVTVAATSATLVWRAISIGRASRQEQRRLFQSCGVMLLLGFFHALMMLQAMKATPALRAAGFVTTVKVAFGFTFNFFLAGLRSFALTSPAIPHSSAMGYSWPFGLLLILGIAGGLFRYLRGRVEVGRGRATTSMLLVFSVTGFFAMVALIVGRQMTGEAADAWVVWPYFTVLPRYIIPLQFFFVGPLVVGVALLAKRASRLVFLGLCLLVPAVVATQVTYQKTAMVFLTEGERVSHYTSWRLLVAAARECRDAGLPLPNFSMAPLTREFSEADVASFLPLLRHDLKLPLDAKIELAPLQVYKSERERYRLAPSVAAFEQKLELARD